MVPLDPERDFHQIGGIFSPVASIWACFEQKRIFRHLVYVSWSVHQITYFLEITDLVSKKKFKPQEMIEMDHLEGGLNFFYGWVTGGWNAGRQDGGGKGREAGGAKYIHKLHLSIGIYNLRWAGQPA